uniref:Uncharacterized protein n=1 Tax=Oryza barthii TaxID=65489 RepID=A0A0D3EVL5_9ORYZ
MEPPPASSSSRRPIAAYRVQIRPDLESSVEGEAGNEEETTEREVGGSSRRKPSSWAQAASTIERR